MNHFNKQTIPFPTYPVNNHPQKLPQKHISLTIALNKILIKKDETRIVQVQMKDKNYYKYKKNCLTPNQDQIG